MTKYLIFVTDEKGLNLPENGAQIVSFATDAELHWATVLFDHFGVGKVFVNEILEALDLQTTGGKQTNLNQNNTYYSYPTTIVRGRS